MVDPTADNLHCKKCGYNFIVGDNFIFHIVDRHTRDVLYDLVYENAGLREKLLREYIEEIKK